MLTKLIKHEMKACSRLLLPLYLVLLVLTIMDKILLSLNIFKGVLGIITGFFTVVYIMSIIAIMAVTTIIIILRFYKNLVTDEGYLMFTLPVTPHELISSKLISSFIWTMLSLIAVLSSIFAVVITGERLKMIPEAIQLTMQELTATFGNLTALLIIEIIAYFIFAIFCSTLIYYASIAVGQLFNGHKVLGSFVAYAGFNIISQIIVTVVILIAGLVFKDTLTDHRYIVTLLLPGLFLYIIIFSIIYYAITNYIFSKKLNLE